MHVSATRGETFGVTLGCMVGAGTMPVVIAAAAGEPIAFVMGTMIGSLTGFVAGSAPLAGSGRDNAKTRSRQAQAATRTRSFSTQGMSGAWLSAPEYRISTLHSST